jgi:transposase
MLPSSRSIATDKGQKGSQSQAVGRSKGGTTTKILALTNALGNLIRFVLLPGHRFDTVGVAPLIAGLDFEGFIADKAFDSNSIIADLNERGAKIVISQHLRRASPLPIDVEIYKWRHLTENFFCKLKEFKRIAMRADKTDQSFAANIHLATVINSRRISTDPRISWAFLRIGQVSEQNGVRAHLRWFETYFGSDCLINQKERESR